MLIYRPHRGSLAEAMAEAKTFNSFDEIKEYVANKWNSVWGYQILNPDDIVLDEEFHNDDRPGLTRFIFSTEKPDDKVVCGFYIV